MLDQNAVEAVVIMLMASVMWFWVIQEMSGSFSRDALLTLRGVGAISGWLFPPVLLLARYADLTSRDWQFIFIMLGGLLVGVNSFSAYTYYADWRKRKSPPVPPPPTAS